MRVSLLVSLAGLFFLAGCAFLTGGRDQEGWALHHMLLADSLEHASMFRQASMEYGIVAQRYKGTSYYAPAVMKLAYLNVNPLNPGRNDSVALSWVTVYLSLPLTNEELANARMYYTLLQRIRFIQTDIDRQAFVADSLQTVSKRQTTDGAALTHRVQELEAALNQATEELAKLKEVDVRLSKARGKK